MDLHRGSGLVLRGHLAVKFGAGIAILGESCGRFSLDAPKTGVSRFWRKRGPRAAHTSIYRYRKMGEKGPKMTDEGSSISTGNTVVTTERLRQVVAAINTNKMYVKDRTREMQEAKKQILGSDLPPVAFSALWRMRVMSDAERLTVVKAVQDYERHLGGNAFKNLEAIDADRLEAAKDVRDAKKSAKELGINVRALNIVLRFEQLDEVEREEMFNDLDRYGVALRYW